MIGKTIAELAQGDSAEIVRTVSMDDIAGFVEAVGDHNPVHSDPGYAATTTFREPIAPGIFTAGLISAVIGTRLPGPGAIYLSQSLKFTKPVRAGDTITTRVEVLEVMRERNRIRLSTVCRNQRGEDVLMGEAWVMPSRAPITYDGAPSCRPPRLPLALQPWSVAAQALALWGSLALAVLAASLPRSTTSAGRR
ncbi:MAG TPA: MaoC family dehydratase [Methylomirabilota bacterium]|nr:MaoC family dehydratase [Methylomirabilota bacterium]